MKVRPAALIIRDGAVLTMRYQYGDEFVHVLPGGNPDPGESLPEALSRELKEELGIEAGIGNLVLAGEVLDFKGREDTLHCLFLADITAGEPDLDWGHTTAQAIEWVPPGRLGEITLYPNFTSSLRASLAPGSFTYTGRLSQPYRGD